MRIFVVVSVILLNIFQLQAQLQWSTYVGNNSDYFHRIHVNSGYPFLLGSSNSTNYPTTTGAYDQSLNGDNDFIITKLNQNGSSLIFSTFVGGSNNDYCYPGIFLDNSNNIYVAGNTYSNDFPTSSGAYDQSYNGERDLVVFSINSSGSILNFSTYLGTTAEDFGFSIVVDNSGNSYISGCTSSANYPTTSGAYDQSYNDGLDAIITKLNSTASDLDFSTYLGGSYNDVQGVDEIKIDANNNIYVTGDTQSDDYPTTSGAFDQTFNGNGDIFITKLNPSGSSLIFSTYIGGTANELSLNIFIDNDENCYTSGGTLSNNFPTSTGAYDQSYNGGSRDAVLLELNSFGTNLIFSTFIGGSDFDDCYSVHMDESSNLIFSGYTNSSNFPTSTNSYDNTLNGTNTNDIFISKLSSDGTSLLYSSYLGGEGEDYSFSSDYSSNYLFITGGTSSSDFPVTSAAYDQSFNGIYDGFVTKFEISNTSPQIASLNTKIFNGLVCYSSILDTIWVKSTGTDELSISNSSITGTNATEFQRIAPANWPQTVRAGDSIRVVIRFTPSSVGAKTAKLSLTNNSETNPWDINLSGRKDSVGFAMNNIAGDTLVIDFGIVCPNTPKDTSITIKNTSTIPTTLYFGGVNSPFSILRVEGTKKEEDNDAVLRKEKK